jgi:hypothetical protein
MQGTPRAPRHEVDGKPLKHIGRAGVRIPNFGRQYLVAPARKFRRASSAIRPELAGYDLGGSGGDRQAGNRPIETCITGMNKDANTWQ